MDYELFKTFKKGTLLKCTQRHLKSTFYLMKVRAKSDLVRVIYADGFKRSGGSNRFDGQFQQNAGGSYDILWATVKLLPTDSEKEEAAMLFERGLIDKPPSSRITSMNDELRSYLSDLDHLSPTFTSGNSYGGRELYHRPVELARF